MVRRGWIIHGWEGKISRITMEKCEEKHWGREVSTHY